MTATAELAIQPAQRRASSPGFFSLDLLDDRYPSLHGFRVLAIVSVVQYHVTWIFAGEQGIKLDRRFVDGSLTVFFGMDLFFILSGFLIGSILIRSLATSGTQNIRRFYVRRVFRTFPPYYIVLTVLASTYALTAAQRSHLVYEYVYGTNFLPLERPEVIMFWGWSLALEEQFYLTVPLLFFVLHRLKSDRLRIALLAVLWASALVVRLVIFYRWRPWNDFVLYGAVYFRTYTRYDTLVAGILLAFVHARYKERIARWLEAPFHRALLALPSLGCLWLLLRPTMFGAGQAQLVHMFVWGTVTSLMYLPLLTLLLHSKSPIERLLAWPGFRRIATLGYGVYLVHIPLIDHVLVPFARRMQARDVPMWFVWPASLSAVLAMSFVIAYVMHLVVEKPSLRIRERLSR
jgi:peptidoglycan/LPS O-acetylase OafA/YrhL